jgi:hypothetical protein
MKKLILLTILGLMIFSFGIVSAYSCEDGDEIFESLRDLMKQFRDSGVFDENFDLWEDGEITNTDLGAFRSFCTTDETNHKMMFDKVLRGVNARACSVTGDDNYLEYLDVNSDGVIDKDDASLIAGVLNDGRTNPVSYSVPEDCAVCTDSDGGKDYYEKGRVISRAGDESAWDSCEGSVLTELTCDEQGGKDYEYTCPNGCDDGACVNQGIIDMGEIAVVGRLVDEMTGEPIVGAKLYSAYEFSPSEVITGPNGKFEFTVTTEFKIKEGIEKGQSDSGGTWAFLDDCHGWADNIGFQKNYEVWKDGMLDKSYSLALRNSRFDAEEEVEDASGKEVVNIGDVYAWPQADIAIESDIEAGYDVMYKYRNSEGYNGPGQSGYSRDHYLSNALPLGYDVFIQFEDEAGNEYASSTYKVPSGAGCGIVSLRYFNGESEWSMVEEVEPTEESGPIVVEIPESVEEENPEIISRICAGCFLEDKCYPAMYRKGENYCSVDEEWVVQRVAEESCENSFECDSNLCVDGGCISAGFFRRMMNWFRGWFS